MKTIMKTGIFTLVQLVTFGFGFAQPKVMDCNGQQQVDAISLTLKSCDFLIKNGKKNVVNGQYKDGQKIGIWSYYDNNGKLLLKRNYFNSLSYEPVFPKLPKAHSELGIGTIKQKERDSLGMLPYHFIQEKDVVWSISYLQVNWFEDQRELVSEAILQSAFSQLLRDESIGKYQSMDLPIPIAFSENELDNLTFIGFLSKIEKFLDGNRQVGEARIIAIQPLVVNEEKDTLLMPAIYYPHARKNLSGFAVNSYDYVQQLDDLFYYSVFQGPIHKLYNSQINMDYKAHFPKDYCFLHRELQEIDSMIEQQIRYMNGVEEVGLKMDN